MSDRNHLGGVAQTVRTPMMGIAVISLLANLDSAWVLLHQGDVKDNLNLRSAYLHVLGDALGSVGAIVAGALMCFFGWYIADPIVSVLVALLILRGAWGVVSQSVHILMEGSPAGADVQAIVAALKSIKGVCNMSMSGQLPSGMTCSAGILWYVQEQISVG